VREIPLTIFRGFCMGAADIVPGVSGGTVALVFGIYRRLIDSIRLGSSAIGRFVKMDLTGGMERLRQVEWAFLIPLLGGIGLAVVTLSHLIETLLHDHPVQMSALFLGLVAGSAVIAWKLLQRRDGTRAMVLVAAAIITFLLLGLRGGTTEDAVAQVADPALWIFFGAGAIAICAMILPGVSGSFLLVTMGMYGAVLGSVNERDLLPLALFLLGCVTGLGWFSQVLHWALENYYDTVMAVLVGLMIGSVRVLWPWPDGVESTELGAPTAPIVGPILLALLGLVVVLAVQYVSERLENRTTGDEISDLKA
jgi:putative membrane protein